MPLVELGMGKKKKKVSDELIQSVMDELQSSPEESNVFLRPPEKGEIIPSPIGSAVLNDPASEESIRHLSIVKNIEPEATLLVNEKVKKTSPKPQSSPPPSMPYTQRPASVSEAQLAQAENLRIAQNRIIELEKELEKIRQENEMLASAAELAKTRADELIDKIQNVEKARVDLLEQSEMESRIYKDNLAGKDRELIRLKNKVSDLESRLAADLKKIRVRERELENRLELTKMEKLALVQSKDATILDLKNKIDQLDTELDRYKTRCQDLNQKIDGNHEQLRRTVRALRLALTNLEVADPEPGTEPGTIAPIKKAE